MPWLAGSGYDEASLQHVLDMTVALDFDETYTTGDEFLRFDASLGFRPWVWPGPALDCLGSIPGIGRDPRPHGERFHYCSPNTEVLGWAIELATGRSFAEAVSERIWGPMGAEADSEIALDRGGTAAADGGLCATVRDYARFGLLAARGGAAGGRQVVPAAWVAGTWEAGDREAMRRSGEAVATSYHNQWWRYDELMCAIGIHGQQICVDRDEDLVVAWCASAPDAIDDELAAAQRAATRAVRAEL